MLTWRWAATAATSAAGDHGHAAEAVHPRPDIRAAGEPDDLLSSFINDIKHLPCGFG